MRQNPHVRICGGPGSATTLVYPTPLGGGNADRAGRTATTRPVPCRPLDLVDWGVPCCATDSMTCH